ncbi:MAG: hypothetical protein PWP70_1163 [Moorella sp. (in: firmicutes)]|nr:hypothetical protein [Moorella sp. (in: firmicutes)]
MAEGVLKCKTDAGGYRHYILTEDCREIELHCGCALAVKLGAWIEGSFKPEGWLKGRYEADLCWPAPKAFLYFQASPQIELCCLIPEGVEVKTK